MIENSLVYLNELDELTEYVVSLKKKVLMRKKIDVFE